MRSLSRYWQKCRSEANVPDHQHESSKCHFASRWPLVLPEGILSVIEPDWSIKNTNAVG